MGSDKEDKVRSRIRSQGIDPYAASELRSELQNSELAVEILHNIWKKGSNYTSQIARDLERPQPSIDRVISKLREAEILVESSRGRSIYFEIDYENIVYFVLNAVGQSYLQKNLMLSKDEDLNLREIYDEELVEDYQEFLEYFFKIYSDSEFEKIFGELFFDDFFTLLQVKNLREEEYHFEFLELYILSESSDFGYIAAHEFSSRPEVLGDLSDFNVDMDFEDE
jgi:DNA-binding transcriptional ArsR family regulator